jgi:hypothetical protein
VQLLAIASHPGAMRRLGGWRAARLAFACSLTLAVIGAGTVLCASSGGAATAGWYVAPTPGTGSDDVLLGSSCANSVQCMAVGITLNNLGSNGTDTPLVETWNGLSWTLAAQPPLPSAPAAASSTSVASADLTAGRSGWLSVWVVTETRQLR